MPKTIIHSDVILFVEPSVNGEKKYLLLKPNQITGRRYNQKGAYGLVESLSTTQTRLRLTLRAKQQLKQYESQKQRKHLVDSLKCPSLESMLKFLPKGCQKLIDFNYQQE